MDLGTIGILFSYLVIVAMSATVVTLVVVYARRLPSVDGVRELDERSNKRLELTREKKAKRRSGRSALIGNGIRRRAVPSGREDSESWPVAGVTESLIQQPKRAGVKTRLGRWLTVKRIPAFWRRQPPVGQKVHLPEDVEVEDRGSTYVVHGSPPMDGAVQDREQAQVGAAESESVRMVYDDALPDDAHIGDEQESEGLAARDLATKEAEAMMDDRLEVKSEEAGLDPQPHDVDPVESEDRQEQVAGAGEAAGESEVKRTATQEPETRQESSETPEVRVESEETDQQVQQQPMGMGDLSELFARSTSGEAKTNALAEQMDDVDTSELLRRGRELLNSLKRSDN